MKYQTKGRMIKQFVFDCESGIIPTENTLKAKMESSWF